MPAKPYAKIRHKDTLQLLMDNIGCLEYRMPGASTLLKLPYFQPRFSGDPSGTREVTRRFCEAIIQLLEKHDQLK